MNKAPLSTTLSYRWALLAIIALAAFSTLPWIGFSEFYTKGEPREAGLVVYMLDQMTWDAWIIPQSYADEFAYKPPLTHWLMAVSSMIFNGGEVSPLTARIPSALALIVMMGSFFVFIAKRRSIKEAFIACFIAITCFELHRSGMSCRIDMVLSSLMIGALMQLYCWYEKRKPSQLIAVWVLLSFATLAKGPVGSVVPLLIFFIYLLAVREKFWNAFKWCVMFFFPALILPALWYYFAYQIEGEPFLIKSLSENVGRFLSLKTENMGADYVLGVENPWYYYPPSILGGLIPWTILLLLSIPLIPFRKIKKFKNIFKNREQWHPLNLFCFITIVVSLIFFTIPTSKRSVYILYLYPFFSFYLARLFMLLADRKHIAINISTGILASVSILALATMILSGSNIVSLEGLSGRERTVHDIELFVALFRNPTFWGYTTMLILGCLAVYSFVALSKSRGYKILFLGFALSYTINIMQDSYLLPAFKNAYSSKPIAEAFTAKYNLRDKTYVTNNLLAEYYNMYGLNYYMGNNFKNFEKELPEEGYFITGKRVNERFRETYSDRYNFTLLEESPDRFNDFRDQIMLFRFEKK